MLQPCMFIKRSETHSISPHIVNMPHWHLSEHAQVCIRILRFTYKQTIIVRSVKDCTNGFYGL